MLASCFCLHDPTSRQATDIRLTRCPSICFCTNNECQTRVVRSHHRRPLSTAAPSYQPLSPPRMTRRLSDQQETARPRNLDDDRSSVVSRGQSVRSNMRDRAPLTHTGDDGSRTRPSSSFYRSSPLTPRTIAFQEPNDYSSHGRRRTSVTESNSGYLPRTHSHKNSSTSHQARSHHPSPLVPRPEPHHGMEPHGGVEGTESTTSTTAPSTVWDELDDLKSRIHRLELTGKIPPTSGAAMSRISDERPPTATTTVTTMSTSPRRGSVSGAHMGDTSSTVSKETHPILQTALSKSKPFLSPEVFNALEVAAQDALGLSSLMGAPGQPGPISSAVSSAGASAVTDRQLRRKADSVCRSLTELCLAMSEDVARTKGHYSEEHSEDQQNEAPTTPTMSKFPNLSHVRRPSTTLSRSNTSPRAVSKLEERRNHLLNGTALPSPRFVDSAPMTSTESGIPGRKSSLLVNRTRRAGTEEPDEGRRSSLLLRTRRAGTEEPDEGRKTSLLMRNRRGTVGEEDNEDRFRAPSRATTELATPRQSHQREYMSQVPAQDFSSTPSALPRRRFVSSSMNSRLAQPSGSPQTPSGQRYLQRPTPDRESSNVSERHVEDLGQRLLSLGQTAMLNRTGSLSRRQQANRDNGAAGTAGTTYR